MTKLADNNIKHICLLILKISAKKSYELDNKNGKIFYSGQNQYHSTRVHLKPQKVWCGVGSVRT